MEKDVQVKRDALKEAEEQLQAATELVQAANSEVEQARKQVGTAGGANDMAVDQDSSSKARPRSQQQAMTELLAGKSAEGKPEDNLERYKQNYRVLL